MRSGLGAVISRDPPNDLKASLLGLGNFGIHVSHVLVNDGFDFIPVLQAELPEHRIGDERGVLRVDFQRVAELLKLLVSCP